MSFIQHLIHTAKGLVYHAKALSVSNPTTSALLAPLFLLLAYRIMQYLTSLRRVGAMSERYVLVTGCARGFGFDIAKRLDSLGCHVFACCRSERGMAELDQATSDRCEVLQMDVSNPESVRKMFDYVKSKLPPGKGLWGLVNNAGISGSRSGPVDWLTSNDYREVIEVNFLGTVDVTMAFLPLIKKARGRVILFSSTMTILVPTFGLNYTISKFCIEGFNDALRRTLRPYGCRVVVLNPGLFKTDLVSEDNFQQIVDKSWKELPQETRDCYGEGFVPKYVQSLVRSGDYDVGNSVSLVSDAVEAGLFSKNPRPRYLVGKDVKYFYSVLAALPVHLGDWIFEKLAAMPEPRDVNAY